MATADTGWTDGEDSKGRGGKTSCTPTSNTSLGEFSLNSQRPLVHSSTTSEAGLGDEEINILFRKAGISQDPSRRRDDDTSCHDDDTSITSRGECRVGQCRLPCLQPCATIATFTVMCCALATLNGALTAGYVNSVITTIEKRFEIGSSFSGIVLLSIRFNYFHLKTHIQCHT